MSPFGSSESRRALDTKLYYSIGEVAEITQLPQYTLRAWEKEFSCLRPRRVRGKNRAYRERDIGIILLIKRLLHQDRYSTRGARQKLKNEPELVRSAGESMAGFRKAAGKVEASTALQPPANPRSARVSSGTASNSGTASKGQNYNRQLVQFLSELRIELEFILKQLS